MTAFDEIRDAIGEGLADIFLDATLSRDAIAAGENDWTPGAVTTTDYACKAIHEDWSAAWVAGGLVNAGERRVLVLATTLDATPAPGDRITIRGETFTIVGDGGGQSAVSTDPAQAVWVLRAKV